MSKSLLLQFLTSSYGLLTEKSWMPPHLYTPMRGGLRRMAMKVLPIYFSKNPARKNRRRYSDLIVSLTSFPARIDYVYIVIESLLRQTVLPYKIILWLSNQQFSGFESLPESLLKLQGDIFEIRFVDGDVKSHKKYFYVSKEYPDCLAVLVDDDILYPPGMIEELHTAHERGVGDVICRYGCRVLADDAGNLKPYEQWPQIYQEESGNDIFFGSGGGTLFCPKDFTEALTDIESAIDLTPYSDDIWLNYAARVAHLKIAMLRHRRFFPLNIPDNQPLVRKNVEEGQNDRQLINIMSLCETNNLFKK